jgi:hypothetical protein
MEALRFKGPRTDLDGTTVQGPVEVTAANPLPVSATIDTGDLATEASLQNLITAVSQPATEIPHEALDATLDVTHANVSRTGAGETTMVSATSSQTTRLHEYIVTVPGAGTVEIRDGASGTALVKHIFAAADGVGREFNGRPWGVTTANTALIFYWSGSGEANIDFFYKKSA